jgi:subtilisin family serine protease
MVVDELSIGRSAGAGANPHASLRLVRLTELMEISAGVPDIAVAVIDGPIAWNHSDLVRSNIRVLDESAGTACDRPDNAACGHGTYVAGLLNARRDAPVSGICPGCRLLVRSIFSGAEGKDVLSATPEELAVALDEAIAHGAEIINLSLGLMDVSPRGERAIKQSLDHAMRYGAIVVAAAGDHGRVGSSAITRHPWVIPVVACYGDGRPIAKADLGVSAGRKGLAAPGHNINSLAAGGGYGAFSGSSAATPFVSGTIALLWSIFTTASATQLRLAVLGNQTRRRSVSPPLLDASAVLQALTTTISTRVGALAR